MAFSTGFYSQNVAPAQLDARLQAPLLKQRVDGLSTVFGKGFEFLTDILEKQEQYKNQMARVAQENDARAADLAESGISSTDAIQMAWEETRYAVPKTWGDVGKQNAVSDLASKANNGWTGGQSSAIVVETGLAQLQDAEENGINGVPLEDFDWINGDGLEKLIQLTRPKPETMLALGPNAKRVRNKLLTRAIKISNNYTKKQKEENIRLEIAGGTANMRNMVQDLIDGDPIDSHLSNQVSSFYQSYPAEAPKIAVGIVEEVLGKTARDNDLVDAEDLIPALTPFASQFGIDLDSMDMTNLMRSAAEAGNKRETLVRTEKIDEAVAKIEALEPEQRTKENFALVFDSVGLTEADYDAGLDAEILNEASNVNTELEAIRLGIGEGTYSLQDGINELAGLSDSIPFNLEWTDKFVKANRGFLSRQRSQRTLDALERRNRAENWRSFKPNIDFKVDTTFSENRGFNLPTGQTGARLTPEASEAAKAEAQRAIVDVKRAHDNGEISEEKMWEDIDKINRSVEYIFMRDLNNFVGLGSNASDTSAEGRASPQDLGLTGGIRAR